MEIQYSQKQSDAECSLLCKEAVPDPCLVAGTLSLPFFLFPADGNSMLREAV
jgi:hypothetical protein